MNFIMGRLWKPSQDSSLKIDSNCDGAITLTCFRYLVSKTKRNSRFEERGRFCYPSLFHPSPYATPFVISLRFTSN